MITNVMTTIYAGDCLTGVVIGTFDGPPQDDASALGFVASGTYALPVLNYTIVADNDPDRANTCSYCEVRDIMYLGCVFMSTQKNTDNPYVLTCGGEQLTCNGVCLTCLS
jgi:hypothetical protein